MRGLGSLFSLIILAALPIGLACLWLIIRKYKFTTVWFLCSLLAGFLSVGIAYFIQSLFPAMYMETIWDLLKKIVLQTAVPEEGSRLIAAFIFFALAKRWKRLGPIETQSGGAAAGVIMGLGFALLETIAYSITNIQVTLLRAFTSSPLHAACGVRAGMGAVSFRQRRTASGIWNIVLAVLIHSAYNFSIVSPRAPAFLPIIIVLAGTISSLVYIRAE